MAELHEGRVLVETWVSLWVDSRPAIPGIRCGHLLLKHQAAVSTFAIELYEKTQESEVSRTSLTIITKWILCANYVVCVQPLLVSCHQGEDGFRLT